MTSCGGGGTIATLRVHYYTIIFDVFCTHITNPLLYIYKSKAMKIKKKKTINMYDKNYQQIIHLKVYYITRSQHFIVFYTNIFTV